MVSNAPSSDDREIYTVSRLARAVRGLLEDAFPLIWVEGELSGLSRPASGHIYFTLKDDRSQVRCAMFRGKNRSLGFKPEDGMQVLVRGRVGLYEARGDFQLVAEQMEPAGDGALRRAFDALKHKLEQEGLFDAARKQIIPEHPATIGIVTSPTGAAIHDILTVLRRRYPGIGVILYPTRVQGEDAGAEIAAAISTADRRSECDVLLISRGGGSLEDLWAFNEEIVARAIADCRLPTISAVGHEVDFTIADFVADLRAPTPSAAAELLSPDASELHARLGKLSERMASLQSTRLAQLEQKIEWLHRQLQRCHPGNRVTQHLQRLDELNERLATVVQHAIARHRADVRTLSAKLHQYNPAGRLRLLATRQSALKTRLFRATNSQLERLGGKLETLARSLDAVSPLATLARGYAIVQLTDGTVLRHAAEVKPGVQISARLSEGVLQCTVDQVKEDVS